MSKVVEWKRGDSTRLCYQRIPSTITTAVEQGYRCPAVSHVSPIVIGLDGGHALRGASLSRGSVSRVFILARLSQREAVRWFVFVVC